MLSHLNKPVKRADAIAVLAGLNVMPIMDRMAIIAFRARMAAIVWMVMIDILALIAVLAGIAQLQR